VTLLRVGLLAALAALVLAAASSSAPATSPGRNGLIVFDSSRTGNTDIYTMTSAGKQVRRLTRSSQMDRYAAWSPDGHRIAFVRGRINGAIYVMTSKGQKARRLTKPALYESDATWSADGKQIAFSAQVGAGRAKIYVVNVATRKVRKLTKGRGDDFACSWSPDGKKIVFASNRDHPSGDANQLYVMSPDGSHVRKLTHAGGIAYEAVSWSPDGKKLAAAFVSPPGGSYAVAIINADGTGLDTIRGSVYDVAWSPDGRELAFTAAPGTEVAHNQVYLMNADGGGVRRLTHNRSSTDGDPDWQPLR